MSDEGGDAPDNDSTVNRIIGDPETAMQLRDLRGDIYINSQVFADKLRSAEGAPGALRVLAVEDELHALEEIVRLLREDVRIGKVEGVSDALTAARYIHYVLKHKEPLDAVFLDVEMPGLNGMDLARMIARFADPPALVFVTAWEEHAIEAFELNVVDYLLKPVQRDRLTSAVDKLLRKMLPVDRSQSSAESTIPVESSRGAKFIRLSDVCFVEECEDHVRLRTETEDFLTRVPMSVLAMDWAEAGFARIGARHLVAVRHVAKIRLANGGMTVQVGGQMLTVGDEYLREARNLLVRKSRRQELE